MSDDLQMRDSGSLHAISFKQQRPQQLRRLAPSTLGAAVFCCEDLLALPASPTTA